MTVGELYERRGEIPWPEYLPAMQGHHRRLLEYPALLRNDTLERIEISPEGVVLVCRGTGLRLSYQDPEDVYGCLTLLSLGYLDWQEMALNERILGVLVAGSGFGFLDVGANFGWYSLNLALRHPLAQIHAFEPLPSTFKVLETNVRLNGLGQVKVHNLGLLAEPGSETFYLDPRISGRASARNLVGDPAAQAIACQTTTLDLAAEAFGIAPDLMKVDVEGAELFVLQGGRATLARHLPVVQAELFRKWASRFGYHIDEVLALMAGLGYQCWYPEGGRFNELVAMTEAVNANNFWFLHRDKHAGVLAELRKDYPG